MSKYVIVGSGTVGGDVASLLAAQQHQVTVVSRSGGGSVSPLITGVALDASNADELSRLAEGAAAIFNCANPLYHRWPTDWPPIASALLVAAARSNAVLTTLSNLYVYGRASGPMAPDAPLLADYEKAQVRATMWRDALAAHERGELRACEVRASDFVGPGSQSVLGRLIPTLLKGKTCRVLGSPDQPHSWTYTHDVARTLVACAQRPEAWGEVWHAPTNEPRTQRDALNELADLAGVPHVKVRSVPLVALRAAGLFSPTLREFPTTLYQFTAPFVIDDTATRLKLGLEPTPWPEVLLECVNAAR